MLHTETSNALVPYRPLDRNYSMLPVSIYDAYNILGIEFGSTVAEIKKAYHAKSRQTHSDINTSERANFQAVQVAYEMIIGEDLKRQASLPIDEIKRAFADMNSSTIAILTPFFNKLNAALSSETGEEVLTKKWRDEYAISLDKAKDLELLLCNIEEYLTKFKKHIETFQEEETELKNCSTLLKTHF